MKGGFIGNAPRHRYTLRPRQFFITPSRRSMCFFTLNTLLGVKKGEFPTLGVTQAHGGTRMRFNIFPTLLSTLGKKKKSQTTDLHP